MLVESTATIPNVLPKKGVLPMSSQNLNGSPDPREAWELLGYETPAEQVAHDSDEARRICAMAPEPLTNERYEKRDEFLILHQLRRSSTQQLPQVVSKVATTQQMAQVKVSTTAATQPLPVTTARRDHHVEVIETPAVERLRQVLHDGKTCPMPAALRPTTVLPRAEALTTITPQIIPIDQFDQGEVWNRRHLVSACAVGTLLAATISGAIALIMR